VSATEIACFTAVSEEVAGEMAWGVLQETREADLAVSITGHLGPDAPATLDGIVWLGTVRRHAGRIDGPRTMRHVLNNTLRVSRQREAATLVLRQARRAILDCGS
jgi:nicotinamide-nucleotide amidase